MILIHLDDALLKAGAMRFELQCIASFPEVAHAAVMAVREVLLRKREQARTRLASEGITDPTEEQLFGTMMQICGETH